MAFGDRMAHGIFGNTNQTGLFVILICFCKTVTAAHGAFGLVATWRHDKIHMTFIAIDACIIGQIFTIYICLTLDPCLLRAESVDSQHNLLRKFSKDELLRHIFCTVCRLRLIVSLRENEVSIYRDTCYVWVEYLFSRIHLLLIKFSNTSSCIIFLPQFGKLLLIGICESDKYQFIKTPVMCGQSFSLLTSTY